MQAALFRRYRQIFVFSQSLTILLLGAIVYAHRVGFVISVPDIRLMRFLSLSFLLGTVLLAVALPIVLRSLFYERSRRNGGLLSRAFAILQYTSLAAVALGEIAALGAYLVPILDTHLYLSMLAVVYGVYSILPSRTRLGKDWVGFSVQPVSEHRLCR